MTTTTKKKNVQTGIFNRKLLANARFPSGRATLIIPCEIEKILQGLSLADAQRIREFLSENVRQPLEFPIVESSDEIPNRIVPFSKTLEKGYDDFDCWVCFYEKDANFEALRNNPFKYIPHLLKFRGVISPDYTLQTRTARCTQILNTYCGRVIASHLQQLGQNVILHIRYAGKVSGEFFCDSIPPDSVVALGALGCMGRRSRKRQFFFEGLDLLVKLRRPRRLIIYGSTDRKAFWKYELQGIEVLLYPPWTRVAKEKYRPVKHGGAENERQRRLF